MISQKNSTVLSLYHHKSILSIKRYLIATYLLPICYLPILTQTNTEKQKPRYNAVSRTIARLKRDGGDDGSIPYLCGLSADLIPI